jgi:Asp-tRNA(Asn)/Glu-tRNA(Gln) amidotransferase A subunit family amidase
VVEEAEMTTKATTRLVREGEFVAEVTVDLIEAEGGWAPYLSLDDAYRLDDVRTALQAGDLERASRLATRVYRLTPVTA